MPAPPPDGSSSESPLPVFRPQPGTLLNLALIALALVALLVIAVRSGGDDLGVEVERRDAPGGIDTLMVQIDGAVASPGLIEAQPGDRLADLIDRAGGPLPDADLSTLNLALRVRDEDAVHVPFVGEVLAIALVDLNAATQAELEALPGIGPARATAIIEARPLASVDDLTDRGLIPASVWEEIRTLVVVR
jgi:competence protein ComEA